MADQLRGLGVINVSTFANATGGLVPLDKIGDLAGIAGLAFARRPMPRPTPARSPARRSRARPVDIAQSTFGLSGAGTTIGVLSDSFNALGGYLTDVSTGDFPALRHQPVGPHGRDRRGPRHGPARPCTAPAPRSPFTPRLSARRISPRVSSIFSAISDVVVDDVGYFAEPYFQDGIVAQAVDQAFANGGTYFYVGRQRRAPVARGRLSRRERAPSPGSLQTGMILTQAPASTHGRTSPSPTAPRYSLPSSGTNPSSPVRPDRADRPATSTSRWSTLRPTP